MDSNSFEATIDVAIQRFARDNQELLRRMTPKDRDALALKLTEEFTKPGTDADRAFLRNFRDTLNTWPISWSPAAWAMRDLSDDELRNDLYYRKNMFRALKGPAGDLIKKTEALKTTSIDPVDAPPRGSATPPTHSGPSTSEGVFGFVRNNKGLIGGGLLGALLTSVTGGSAITSVIALAAGSFAGAAIDGQNGLLGIKSGISTGNPPAPSSDTRPVQEISQEPGHGTEHATPITQTAKEKATQAVATLGAKVHFDDPTSADSTEVLTPAGPKAVRNDTGTVRS